MIKHLPRPDGASIAYRDTGSGPELLFAHGLGGSLESWAAQVPFFSTQHRVITFSHRGFHPSTVPGDAPDPADYAGDALALLDHLDIERAVLVCQSMGGWTGIELALQHPERVAGLVLACTTGSLSTESFADAELARWRAESPAVQADLVARGIHVACGARLAETQPERHGAYLAIDAASASLDKVALRARMTAQRVRGPADAARIACPVLAVTGEEDCVVAPRGVALMAGHIPKAQVVGVPMSGHSVYFERPDVFNALVAGFLQVIGWRTPIGPYASEGARLLHEMWEHEEGLSAVGHGFGAQRWPNPRVRAVFEAGSHVEAMTIYYQLDGRDYPYTTTYPVEPYPVELGERQRRGREWQPFDAG